MTRKEISDWKLSLIHFVIGGIISFIAFFLLLYIFVAVAGIKAFNDFIVPMHFDHPRLVGIFVGLVLLIVFIPFGWISARIIRKRYQLMDKWKIIVLSTTYLIASYFVANQYANYLATLQLTDWLGAYQEYHIDFSVQGLTPAFMIGIIFAVVSGFLLKEEKE